MAVRIAMKKSDLDLYFRTFFLNRHLLEYQSCNRQNQRASINEVGDLRIKYIFLVKQIHCTVKALRRPNIYLEKMFWSQKPHVPSHNNFSA